MPPRAQEGLGVLAGSALGAGLGSWTQEARPQTDRSTRAGGAEVRGGGADKVWVLLGRCSRTGAEEVARGRERCPLQKPLIPPESGLIWEWLQPAEPRSYVPPPTPGHQPRKLLPGKRIPGERNEAPCLQNSVGAAKFVPRSSKGRGSCPLASWSHPYGEAESEEVAHAREW